MTSKIPDNVRGFLVLIAAAALVAVPGRAQEADDSTGPPEAEEASPDAEEGSGAPSSGTATEPGAEADSGKAQQGESAGEAESAGEGENGGEGDAESADEGGPLVVEAEEGSVYDDQTFEGEDDDFTPSEEIPVDQPIPFPVDI